MHYIRWLSAMQAQVSLDLTPFFLWTSTSSSCRGAARVPKSSAPSSLSHFSNHLWSAWWKPRVLRVGKNPFMMGISSVLELLDRFSRREACGRFRWIPPPPKRQKNKQLDQFLYWCSIAAGIHIVYTQSAITWELFWSNFRWMVSTNLTMSKICDRWHFRTVSVTWRSIYCRISLLHKVYFYCAVSYLAL